MQQNLQNAQQTAGKAQKGRQYQQWWWGVGGLIVGLIFGCLLSTTLLRAGRRNMVLPNGEKMPPSEQVMGEERRQRGPDEKMTEGSNLVEEKAENTTEMAAEDMNAASGEDVNTAGVTGAENMLDEVMISEE